MKLPSIIAILLTLLAICTRAEDHPVLLNEVATVGEQFIELRKKDMGPISLDKYGIIIAEKDFKNNQKNLKIRAALDLSGLIFIYPYHQIIHFGNMNHQNMMEKPPQPKWRIFDNVNDNTWLQIKENNFLTIFLTKGDKNVLDVVKVQRSRIVHVIEDIMTYLTENVVDYLSIRKFNGPIRDKIIDNIIQFKSPAEQRMSPIFDFVTEYTNGVGLSQSKCGAFIPFDLSGFKTAPRSPTAENVCIDLQQKYIASDHLTDDLNMLSVQDELFGENSQSVENILASGILESQTNDDMSENQDIQNKGACISESELSQRMGITELEVGMILEMKRKLKNDPTFNDAPWLHGHPDFPKWIPMIEEHQADILPVDLIKFIK